MKRCERCFAREVLLADAANLIPIIRPRRRRREINVTERCWTRDRTVKSTRDRAEEKRQEKLELVRQQVESGALVIRQMTAEERARYPPRPPQPKRSGRR